jgi:3-phosphoshikimate 1-carboxyvinyltransferase
VTAICVPNVTDTAADSRLTPTAGAPAARAIVPSADRAGRIGQTRQVQSPWPAPRATSPVDATVVLPGSKSMTNRALLLAALADAPSRVRRPLRARDTTLMLGALCALGLRIVERPAEGRADAVDWTVTPQPLRGPADVDVGLAGTVLRFVPAVAALARGPVTFDGDPRARERPLGPLVTALRALGADVDDGGRGAIPLTIRGHGRVPGGAVTIDASASSQFVSALLLAGARYDGGLDLRHEGPPLPSLPHVAMSVAMLRTAGVEVDDAMPDRWRVAPGPIRAVDVVVEPDLSNAAPFLAAALVTGGQVRVPDWPARTTQAGAALPDLLAEMGATSALDDGGLTLRGTGQVRGLTADLHEVGELAPVLAAACALADSPSRLSGLAHLRGHETDRLAALAYELSALGSDVTETDDGLLIRPRPLHGGVVATYDDHRMAQAGALLGLCVDEVAVQDIATTGKTLPDFVGMWDALLREGR